MGTWERMATNKKVGEKNGYESENSARVEGGKRMRLGRAGSSGLSWRFPKHWPRNAGYFWFQHCDSLSHAMLLNTTAEGFMEAYDYVRKKKKNNKKSLLIYHCHLKITQVAKNKPWILSVMPVFKRQPISSGIHKNIQAVRILQAPIWLSDVATLGITLHNKITEIWHIYFWGSRTWHACINRAWWYLQPVKVLHSIYAKRLQSKRHQEVLKEPWTVPAKIKKEVQKFEVRPAHLCNFIEIHATIAISQLDCSLCNNP